MQIPVSKPNEAPSYQLVISDVDYANLVAAFPNREFSATAYPLSAIIVPDPTSVPDPTPIDPNRLPFGQLFLPADGQSVCPNTLKAFRKAKMFRFNCLIYVAILIGSLNSAYAQSPVPVNTRPSATATILNGAEGQKLITIDGSDAEQTVDQLTYSVVTPPKYGTLEKDPLNSTKWIYIPGKTYKIATGDTLSFKVNDGLLDSDIILMKVNANQSFIVPESGGVIDLSQFSAGSNFTITPISFKLGTFTPVEGSTSKFLFKIGFNYARTKDSTFTYSSDLDSTIRTANLKINYVDDDATIGPVNNMTWTTEQPLRFSISINDKDTKNTALNGLTVTTPDGIVVPYTGRDALETLLLSHTSTVNSLNTDESTTNYTIQWTPKSLGLYTLNVISGKTVRTVTITVKEISTELTNLPIITPPSDIVVLASGTSKYSGKANILANDSVGNRATLSLISATKEGVEVGATLKKFSYNNVTGALTWFPHLKDVGIYKFTVMAMDGGGRRSTSIMNVKVLYPPIVTGKDVFALFMLAHKDEVKGYSNISYINQDGGHATLNTHFSDQIDTLGGIYQTGKTIFSNSSTVVSGRGINKSWGNHAMMVGQIPYKFNMYMSPTSPTMNFHPGHNDDGRGNFEWNAGQQTYICQSRGSSQSELPIIGAYVRTAGAFKKEVFDVLKNNGQLMQTIVMLDHMKRAGDNPTIYMSGAVWPSFTDASKVIYMPMVRAAYAMTLDTIPSVPKITMKSIPPAGVNGVDYYDSGENSVLFSTTQSIATIFRETLPTKVFELDATTSTAAAGTEIIENNWVVTKGDTSKVRIIKLNESGSKVRVEIDYHTAQRVTNNTAPRIVMSSLVEIALFQKTDKGAYSVPAFFTSYSPLNEERIYDEDGKIRQITYTSTVTNDFSRYYLAPKPGTIDVYNYAEDGKFLGWDRKFGTLTEKFGPDGKLIP